MTDDNSDLILIVDDSPDTLGMLNDALESAGMTTLVALEGKQALSIAQKMQPDVILLDAIMPMMDGFETCRQLKANAELSQIPVIFMTGLSDTDSIVEGFDAGGVDYLTKPINPKELIARMNVHLINARKTQSAQEALDTAGQYVFTVTTEGEIKWTTPFVSKLLERADPDGSWRPTLAQELYQWLCRAPAEGNHCLLEAPALKLRAIYIGHSNSNDYLLRLVDDEHSDDISILKESLAVTKREAEVLSWIAKGKTNREIAQILEMSPRTVNKHLEQIFRKIEVDNRTSAASLALDKLQKKRGY